MALILPYRRVDDDKATLNFERVKSAFDGLAPGGGNTILYGTAAPTTEGNDGDFYIRTTTNFIYGPKAGGVWPAGTSLVGPAGSNGTNGTNGNTVLYGTAAPTTEGVNGDFYIRTTTNFIYGPKAGGTWPAGTSLVGPAGTNGTNGNGFFSWDGGQWTYNVNSTTAVDIANVQPTTAAGTGVTLEVIGRLLNNSGAVRTYVFGLWVAGNNYLTYTDGATLAASATAVSMVTIRAHLSIHATNAATASMEIVRTAPTTANTRQAIATTTSGQIWNTTANNLTGTPLIQVTCHGQNATATQQFIRWHRRVTLTN